MSAPKVVGLDLSMTATGICRANGTVQTVKTRDKDGDARLCTIRSAVQDAAFGADLVVIEDWLKKSFAAPILGMVHGAVRVALMDMGVAYVVVSPATLKAFATGKGTADKTAMALSAFKRAEREFTDDNQCDAFWLRCAGLTAMGHTAFAMPLAQVQRLSSVSWPAGVAIPELAA